MRTLFEIVDGAKDGNMPTHEECYYAMLALSALHYFAASDIRKLTAENVSPFMKEFCKTEEFNRFKKALDKSPKEFVGWNNDPANPEYQKFRKAGSKLIDKVINKN